MTTDSLKILDDDKWATNESKIPFRFETTSGTIENKPVEISNTAFSIPKKSMAASSSITGTQITYKTDDQIEGIQTEIQSVNKIKKLNGCVLQVDEASVQCEVYVVDKTVNLRLPKSVVPENIKFGSPISITIDETNKYSRPIVSLREPDKSKMKQFTEKMDELINSLE